MTNPFRGSNSLPISQLPDKVKDISNDDLTILSIHDKTDTTKTTGLGAMSGFNQTLMGKYRTNHLASMVAVNIPTDFTGTPSDFGLNRQPLDDRYISAKHFPFSACGEAGEFSLPIAGSYFGVNMAQGGSAAQPVIFAEDSGDYSVLKIVTNGEDFRWTYSFLNLEKNTCRNTDIEYRPIGLTDDEVIGFIHLPHNDVMVVEIHSKTNFVDRIGFFKEWAIVTLNGTLNHKLHTLHRIGTSFTRFNRTATAQNDREKLRTTILHTQAYGLNITKYDNKYWYILEVDNEFTGRTDIVRAIEVWSAPLTNPGMVTLDPAFTSIGPAGLSGDQRDGKPLILYSEWMTKEASNKAAMFLVSHTDDVTIRNQRMNSNTRATSLGYGEDNIINVITHFYTDINVKPPTFPTSQISYCPQICFLKLDLKAKRLYADTAYGNQRQQIDFRIDGERTIFTGFRLPLNSDIVRANHYWAGGERLAQLKNKAIASARFNYYDSIRISPSANPFDITKQKFGSAKWYSLRTENPTPHHTQHNVIMHYDKALIIGNGGIQNGGIGSIADKKYIMSLEGSRQYELRASARDNPIMIRGYNIPGERTEVPNSPRYNPTTAVDMLTNTPMYGGATFTSVISATQTLPELIDRNGLPAGRTINLSTRVREKLTAMVQNTRHPTLTAEHDQLHQGYWCCSVFAHPKFTYLIIKIRNSFRYSAQPTNVNKMSNSLSSYFLASYTTSVEGNVTVINDFTVLTTQHPFTDSAGYNTNVGNSTVGVLAIYADKAVWHFRNQGGSGTITGGDFAGGQLNSVIFPITDGVVNPNPRVIHYNGITTAHYLYNPAWLIPSYSTRDGIVGTNRIMSNTFAVAMKLNPDTQLFPRAAAEQKTDNMLIFATPRPRDGFSFTITTPIDVYMLGRKLSLPTGTYDLTRYKANPRNTTFYLSVVLSNDRNSVSLTISSTPPKEDTELSMYIGYIITSDSEIKEIVTEPVIRWDATRPSTTLIGSAFPCTTGHPFEQNSVEWFTGIRAPRASYNAAGTVISGTVEPGVRRVQLYQENSPPFAEVDVSNNQFTYTVEEPHNFFHNFTPYVTTPAHTSGQTVYVRGVLVKDDGSEEFTNARRIKAPLIPSIVVMKVWDSYNKDAAEIIVGEQYKLLLFAVGLSNEDKDVDLEIDWKKLGFDSSWEIEHDHDGKINFLGGILARSRIWGKDILFRVKKT